MRCSTTVVAHIMVEVFTNHMPDWIQPWLDFLASIIGFLVLLPIAYGGYVGLVEAIQDEAYFFGDLELPEWPGRLTFFVGYFVFAVRLANLVFHDGYTSFRSLGGAAPSAPAEK